MDCKSSEGALTLQRTLPHPPPLPLNLNSSFHRKSSVTNYGLKTTRQCCCISNAGNSALDRLFDEGYRADVLILTDGGDLIHAHTSILGVASPVLKAMLKKLKGQGRSRRRLIPIRGVPSDAVVVFVRFLYSSCYDEEKMREFALPLLVLSHVYVVPKLKKLCEWWLEQRLITTENVVDIFQLSLLCDAPRLSLVCHRFMMSNIKAVSISDGWRDMRASHPVLEEEIVHSAKDEETMKKERLKKKNEKKVYMQLYEAMEALVHICNEGCLTIGPIDKVLREDQAPCKYSACRGIEALVRHFAGCKLRGVGGCPQCKRMWQTLELHSRICANPDNCKVPLCRKFKQGRRRQSRKEDIRWRILVKKIVRSKSITGAPFFRLE